MKTTIHNLNKRVAALEAIAFARQRTLSNAMESALDWMSGSTVIESLLSAYGAERIGRPFNEAEIRARRRYEQQLRVECRSHGIPYPAQIDHGSYLQHAFPIMIALKFRKEGLELIEGAVLALQEGQTPSEAEREMLIACEAECKRLEQLASGELACSNLEEKNIQEDSSDA